MIDMKDFINSTYRIADTCSSEYCSRRFKWDFEKKLKALTYQEIESIFKDQFYQQSLLKTSFKGHY